MAAQDLQADMLLEGRWRVVNHVGGGAWGAVYVVRDEHQPEGHLRAMKYAGTESGSVKDLNGDYNTLTQLQGTKGICNVHAHYKANDAHRPFFVMDLLGGDLLRLREAAGRFTVATTAKIGLQVVDVLEKVHDAGYIHRDMKPDNLMTGKGGQQGEVFLVDFGLAKKHLAANGRPIKARKDAVCAGTAYWGSPNVHAKRDLGRRDDLISLWIVLLEMMLNDLPWANRTNRADIKKDKKELFAKVEALHNGQAAAPPFTSFYLRRGHQPADPLAEDPLLKDTDELAKAMPPQMRQLWVELNSYKYDTKPNYSYIRTCSRRMPITTRTTGTSPRSSARAQASGRPPRRRPPSTIPSPHPRPLILTPTRPQLLLLQQPRPRPSHDPPPRKNKGEKRPRAEDEEDENEERAGKRRVRREVSAVPKPRGRRRRRRISKKPAKKPPAKETGKKASGKTTKPGRKTPKKKVQAAKTGAAAGVVEVDDEVSPGAPSPSVSTKKQRGKGVADKVRKAPTKKVGKTKKAAAKKKTTAAAKKKVVRRASAPKKKAASAPSARDVRAERRARNKG
ncbi:unnamed protein product [Vitrella brassicaformis CCMP3155]|uniref:Casein kinase I n=1 Tax=Vitrella brassicaformis (strain CCMP3155) TaxID=1169540 RepID=A0A0G4ECW3_VITBC|nr:unnamed protein product [Vitrella brassicaformis CCMP3155]|eukprot:CEL93162.1 unnamed protein product [Vitrella brassicaformis CCMP3155]